MKIIDCTLGLVFKNELFVTIFFDELIPLTQKTKYDIQLEKILVDTQDVYNYILNGSGKSFLANKRKKFKTIMDELDKACDLAITEKINNHKYLDFLYVKKMFEEHIKKFNDSDSNLEIASFSGWQTVLSQEIASLASKRKKIKELSDRLNNKLCFKLAFFRNMDVKISIKCLRNKHLDSLVVMDILCDCGLTLDKIKISILKELKLLNATSLITNPN